MDYNSGIIGILFFFEEVIEHFYSPNTKSIYLSVMQIRIELNSSVYFRLGYFERKYSFYNQSQLTSEIQGHYTQQVE